MSKKSKKTFKGKNDVDYIPTPSAQLKEDDSLEVPFLEKHGAWLFPKNWCEITDKEKAIAEDGPPSLFERATDKKDNENPQRISQKANNNMVFPCGKCCCCYRQMNFFHGLQYPMSQPRLMPPKTRTTRKKQKNFRSGRRSEGKVEKGKEESNVRSVLDKIVEIDGIKDMDLASVVINDAKANFNQAITEAEEKPKITDCEQPIVPVIKSPACSSLSLKIRKIHDEDISTATDTNCRNVMMEEIEKTSEVIKSEVTVCKQPIIPVVKSPACSSLSLKIRKIHDEDISTTTTSDTNCRNVMMEEIEKTSEVTKSESIVHCCSEEAEEDETNATESMVNKSKCCFKIRSKDGKDKKSKEKKETMI